MPINLRNISGPILETRSSIYTRYFKQVCLFDLALLIASGVSFLAYLCPKVS